MKIQLQREDVSRIGAAPPLGGRLLAMLVGDCVNVCEKTPNCAWAHSLSRGPWAV